MKQYINGKQDTKDKPKYCCLNDSNMNKYSKVWLFKNKLSRDALTSVLITTKTFYTRKSNAESA